MSKLGLTPEEENQLKTISEYIFFDQFKDFVTYNRFEQCFQPLFNNIEISLDKVFKSIVGEKKKYINYQRLVKSYLLYKNNDPKIVPDLKTFFEKLFNSILKKENDFVGKPQEKTFSFTTPKACKKRECITSISILGTHDGGINGLIMEYDSVAKAKMYPSKLEQSLLICLDMKLGIVDEKAEKEVGKLEGIKEEFYRDAVTHVFGTISQNTNMITFLGFKCISGKTVFVGYPEGDGFIFGKFGTKFHELKVQMSLEGIILLQPGFNLNRRANFYLNNEANNLTKEDLERDILIQDEVQLSQLSDSIQIDKMITTPIIDENHFFNEKLSDAISGNDYKEVVNQNPREWILKAEGEKVEQTETKAILTLDDALKEMEKEKEKTKELLESGLQDGEMCAKGGKRKRKKNKKKNKKKKERAKNGKLHEVKALVNKKNNTENWNGKADQVKNTTALTFLKNKNNYQKLIDKVTNGINEELTKLRSEFDTSIAQNVMEDFSNNKTIIKTNTNKNAKTIIKSNKNRTIIGKNMIEKPTLMSKNMKGEIKPVHQSSENRAQSVQKPKVKTNIIITGGSKDSNSSLFCSDAQQIINAVQSQIDKSTNLNLIKSFTNESSKMRAKKKEDPVVKWKTFGNKLRRISGVLLLQTIGSILKAMKILSDEIDGKITISLEERISLLNLLQENQVIVDFLNKDTTDNEEEEEEKPEKEETKKEEDLLIPSDNPEDITSLPELETKLAQLNVLLENKNLKSEDKKKLEKLKNLYLQQKNILIENKTEDAKNEVIEQNKIDINKYIKEEEEKRKKAMEEAQKKIDEEMKKEQGKAQNEKSISEIKSEEKIKIFRKQEIYKGKKSWTDPIFKPERESLCPFDGKKHWILPEGAIRDDIAGWEDFKWCRAEDIFDSKNYSVFYEGISVENIVQGGFISDCYFVSALGSLCKFPELIDKLFYYKEKTKEHIYGIYFYINGIKKLVLLDDYFPCVGVGFKQFVMSKSEQNEIWIPLIEKGFAKINGNYIRIGSGGTANEVFDVLTEAFNEEIKIKDNVKEELWEKLIDGEKKGFVMTAGTSGLDYVEDVGLSAGHAYTVLGIHEIKGERVIRLRNPYGEGEFNGDWSDYSSKWTDDLKKKYNYYEKEDGDFFMGYNDFMEYFVIMGIAKLHPTWSSSKLRIKKTEATKCQLIKVKIPEDDILVYFQLYNKNPRIPNKNGQYPFHVLSNIILVDKDFNYIDGTARNEMHICVEKTLKKGEYYLFCDANYRYSGLGNHGYTITAYSSVNIPLENVTSKNPVNDLLRKTIIDYCKKKGEKESKSHGINVYGIKSFNGELPYKVIALENNSNNNYSATVNLKCKGSKSCCFYCDDVGTENDNNVTKNLNGKQTIAFIIMYHNMSSLFDFDYCITDATEHNDPIYNHPVFDEEAEVIDDKGNFKQYSLEKDDDSYYIGIENSSSVKFKLKLVLDGLEVNDGPFKGQSTVIFELNPNERKVFEVLVICDDDIYFSFELA